MARDDTCEVAPTRGSPKPERPGSASRSDAKACGVSGHASGALGARAQTPSTQSGRLPQLKWQARVNGHGSKSQTHKDALSGQDGSGYPRAIPREPGGRSSRLRNVQSLGETLPARCLPEDELGVSSPPHPCLLLTRTSAPASHQRAADGALPACALPAPWAARSSCSTVSPVSCTGDDDATPRGTRFLSSCHSVQGAVSSQAPDNSLHCGPAHIPHVHQDGRRR